MTEEVEGLGVEAASRYVGMSMQTIYRFVRDGMIPARGRPVRILRADLDACFERCRIRPGELAHLKRPATSHRSG